MERQSDRLTRFEHIALSSSLTIMAVSLFVAGIAIIVGMTWLILPMVPYALLLFFSSRIYSGKDPSPILRRILIPLDVLAAASLVAFAWFYS